MDNSEFLECSRLALQEAVSTLDVVQKRLHATPDGVLYVRKCEGKTYYFHREKTSDTNGRYLKKSDADTICSLEEKEYFLTVRKSLQQRIEILKKIIASLSALPDLESLYFDIKPERRHLIGPFSEQINELNSEELKRWKKDARNRNTKGFKNNTQVFYITQNGEKVRSKSEVIIADRLKAANVPYYYEYSKVFVDDDGEFVSWFPDFLVLNRRTGKRYYWEHFGMLDNAEYCASAQFKIEFYAKNGIFLGENLIITSESSQHTLNTQYVDLLIGKYLK